MSQNMEYIWKVFKDKELYNATYLYGREQTKRTAFFFFF